MPIYATKEHGAPRAVADAYWSDDPTKAPEPVQAVYSPGDGYSVPVWQRAGAPVLGLTLTPGMVRSDVSAQPTLSLGIDVQGADAGGATLTVVPESINSGRPIATGLTDGTVTQRYLAPMQDARFVLAATNINGVETTVSRDYYFGLPPRIAYFRTAGYRQGILGLRPDQWSIEWSVEDAHPQALVDVTTTNPAGFHFHPGRQQSGRYAYSRQGGVGSETLTLTATNVFGTVTRRLVLTWT